jgi:hypothetical protein
MVTKPFHQEADMANARPRWVLSSALVWLLFAAAKPAIADEASLQLVEPPGTALSEQDMAHLRGGFPGLPPGSSVFLQLGQQTVAKQQGGTPSAATASLSSTGASLTGSASLGGSGAPPTVAIGSLSQTYGLTTTRSFSVSMVSGL